MTDRQWIECDTCQELVQQYHSYTCSACGCRFCAECSMKHKNRLVCPGCIEDGDTEDKALTDLE